MTTQMTKIVKIVKIMLTMTGYVLHSKNVKQKRRELNLPK